MQEGYTGALYGENEKQGERNTGKRWQAQERELGAGQCMNGESQLAGIFHCNRSLGRQSNLLKKKNRCSLPAVKELAAKICQMLFCRRGAMALQQGQPGAWCCVEGRKDKGWEAGWVLTEISA